ncbi:hypothetical protein PSP6_50073 [Paraburkholderia tropica]|nr:hypothetical protein PSP6_50073 [Paraburkholderia tropica]
MIGNKSVLNNNSRYARRGAPNGPHASREAIIFQVISGSKLLAIGS